MHIINFVVTNAEKATANLTIVSKNPELLRKSWWVVYFIQKKGNTINQSNQNKLSSRLLYLQVAVVTTFDGTKMTVVS